MGGATHQTMEHTPERIRAEEALAQIVRSAPRRAYTKLELLTLLLRTEAGGRLRSDDALADAVMNVAGRVQLQLFGA